MRTFLALCFSVGTTRRIAETMVREAARLKDTGVPIAWVPPAMMHVTLKFFGDIPTESIDAIAARLRPRLAALPPINLSAKSYGAFPVEGPPRVLWVGIEGGKPLAELQQAIESDMEELGFIREPRAFHPHLTVARVVGPPPLSLGDVPWKSDVDFGMEKIGELVIFESQQSSSKNRAGVEYLARARVPFKKQ